MELCTFQVETLEGPIEVEAYSEEHAMRIAEEMTGLEVEQVYRENRYSRLREDQKSEE